MKEKYFLKIYTERLEKIDDLSKDLSNRWFDYNDLKYYVQNSGRKLDFSELKDTAILLMIFKKRNIVRKDRKWTRYI